MANDITKDDLLSFVIKALPYSAQIKNFDTQTEADAIRFHWRGTKFRVSTSLFCEEVGNGILTGSDLALLVECLIKMVYAQSLREIDAK